MFTTTQLPRYTTKQLKKTANHSSTTVTRAGTSRLNTQAFKRLSIGPIARLLPVYTPTKEHSRTYSVHYMGLHKRNLTTVSWLSYLGPMLYRSINFSYTQYMYIETQQRSWSLWEIVAVPARLPEVAAPSAKWKVGYSLTPCPFDKADPCIFGGWPLCVEWALQLLTRVHADTFYSSLKTILFSRARIGSASGY